MTATLGEILQYYYEEHMIRGQIIVQDNGDGAFIAHWDHVALGPQPTPSQLDAMVPQVEIEKQAALDAREESTGELDTLGTITSLAEFSALSDNEKLHWLACQILKGK